MPGSRPWGASWLFMLLVSLAAPEALAQDDTGEAIASPPEGSAGTPPNIVVILADDVGLMDFGAFGGEAATPHIDALAARGAMFTRYHTSPLCAPSRAMLLTGMDNHQTGVATIPEVLPDAHRGQPGYTMSLEPGVTTLASHLGAAGYETFMTGKWHLGNAEGELPIDQGFDRSFLLDASGADNWEQKSYMPFYSEAPWFEDRAPATLPDDFYSSAFMVDKMIEYLEGREPDRPFFAYVSFQAVHIPVQAPEAFTARYEDTYREGWNTLREARWTRAKQLGLIPETADLAAMHPDLRVWDSLSAEEQALFARSMAVNAGMIEAMDHHIGRLIDYLRETGAHDNTVYVVTSDNGPEPSNPLASAAFRVWMQFNDYEWALEGMGTQGSYGFIGPEWASAAAAPGDLFKFYMSEGGIRVPLIMTGPGIVPGRRVDSQALVTDLTPTLLDLAGVPARDGGRPMTGRSLQPVLAGAATQTYGPDDPIGMEVSGNSALIKGDLKLVRNLSRWGAARWQLFDIAADPGETRDLSDIMPERFQELLADYDAYAEAMGVLPVPKGYDMHQAVEESATERALQRYGWMLALLALAILALLYVLYRLVRLVIRRLAPA